MAIDEESRHRLYGRLQEVLGAEEATILIEHLPPVGWADVAAKRDLDVLAERNRLEHDTLEQRMTAAWRAEIIQQTRTMILAMITIMTTGVVAVGSLAFAAAHLV
jgi:hypothetical protein